MFTLHRIIPKSVRRFLLNLPLFRIIFKYFVGNKTVEVHWKGRKFYFNAYRNFGFATVNLDSIEKAQRAFAQEWISKLECKTAWDIGANIGFWTVSLSSMMENGSSILAIEPDIRNISYLKKNASEHNADIRVLNIGVSSREGVAVLNTDETGALNSIEAVNEATFTGQENITVETIDSIAKQFGVPDFIKLDVEGHEYEVIRGGMSTLQARKTIWLIEVTNNGPAVIELLHKTGYTVVNMLGDEIFSPEYYVGAVPAEMYKIWCYKTP